jgi:hypothetical protein
MALRLPLLAALVLGASLTAQAQTAPSAPTPPAPAAAPSAPPAPAGSTTADDKKKAAPKKAATKTPPKKAPAKDAKKTEAKAPSKTFTTGPSEVRDKQGNVIPTSPDAYPIDSALPKKK